MTKTPEISVVMSVYNGAEHLRESMDSILAQEGVEFECIVVNDGSTDDSAKILEEYAFNDKRVRIIHQQNMGLTKALIKGCSEARGEYIARQDADDVALSGKFKKMIDFLEQDSDAAFASCGTRFISPAGEHLYDVNIDPDQAQTHLLMLNANLIRGVSSHGSVLFRRLLYERVGGYRSDFYFAQDLDLWIRLAERGRHIVIPQVLHKTYFEVGSISASHRKKQMRIAEIIVECARLRRSGLSEELSLEKAKTIRPSSKQQVRRLDQARALYFIGSCLKRRGDLKAMSYFKRALLKFPLHIKSAVRLLLG